MLLKWPHSQLCQYDTSRVANRKYQNISWLKAWDHSPVPGFMLMIQT